MQLRAPFGVIKVSDTTDWSNLLFQDHNSYDTLSILHEQCNLSETMGDVSLPKIEDEEVVQETGAQEAEPTKTFLQRNKVFRKKTINITRLSMGYVLCIASQRDLPLHLLRSYSFQAL